MTDLPPTPDLDADDALLEELRALAAEVDPTPEHVLLAARGSYSWRTIDAELAGLVYDSVLDAEPLAIRSEDEARLLTFETPVDAIELEITVVGDERRILGQLVPPGPGVVELRRVGGVLEAEADEHGRFSFDRVKPGPVSLRCRRTSDGAAIETEWVTI